VNASRIYFIFPALRREAISLAEGCEEPEIYDIISAEEAVSLYFIKVEKCVSVGCHEFTRYQPLCSEMTKVQEIPVFILPLILLN
jgi:hypothetical protein